MPAEAEAALILDRKDAIADGVVRLTLWSPGGMPMPAWWPGAHIDLLLGNGMIRQYYLCGNPADHEVWQVAVAREPDGRGGAAWIHDHLHPGMEITARGPRNRFVFTIAEHCLFIAGGIGITAILPMVAAAEKAGTDWRLLYGGRRRAGMAFLDEVSRYGADRVTIRPEDETGLLGLDALLGEPAKDTLVYCCGPEPLLAAVEQRCASWPPRSLRVERFTRDL